VIVSVIFVIFQQNMNFLDRFWKNPQIANFTKIRPVGAVLFHVGGGAGGRIDRQTDGQTGRS
jgi:hypothetical protein